MLESVTDPRVRWVRYASFGPLHQAYDRLPPVWGPLHGLLLLATLLWLAAVLVRSRKLRSWLFIVTTGCLIVSAMASARAEALALLRAPGCHALGFATPYVCTSSAVTSFA